MMTEEMPHSRPPMTHDSQNNPRGPPSNPKSIVRPTIVAIIMIVPQIAPLTMSYESFRPFASRYSRSAALLYSARLRRPKCMPPYTMAATPQATSNKNTPTGHPSSTCRYSSEKINSASPTRIRPMPPMSAAVNVRRASA